MAPGRLIVADTSVWIDYFRGEDRPECEELDRLLGEESEETLALTGLILTEILRGVPDEDEADRVMAHLVALPVLELSTPADNIAAASLSRRARSAGVTVRSTIDLLIATACLKYDATLLHRDRDFDLLAPLCDLKLWSPA